MVVGCSRTVAAEAASRPLNGATAGAAVLDHRNAGNAAAQHQGTGIGEGGVGTDGDRVDHHAAAHPPARVRVHHARGNRVQLEGLRRNGHGVAGVVAAVEARHDVGLAGQQIDDAALAFVAPLRSNYDIQRHDLLPFMIE